MNILLSLAVEAEAVFKLQILVVPEEVRVDIELLQDMQLPPVSAIP